ncbi:MAG: alkaline phosphatase family protein [Planctomycetia bacterium]
MSPAGATGPSRAATWAWLALVLAGIVALGRLSLVAWVEEPVPTGLPRVGGEPGPARPALLVVIDGLREQALWGEPCALPWLRSLAAGGAGGVARAGNPTLTAACVRTLLTGQWPDLVTALRNFDAEVAQGSWLQALHERGARTAHAGDAAVAQLCAPWLAAADTLAFPDRGPVDQGQCDAQAVPFVLGRIAGGCTAVTLHLTGPDHAGHKHGAAGEPYRAACATVDGQVASVVSAFRARHPQATVLVAADHGVSAHGTHGGGEPSAERAPFVLVGPGVARVQGVEVPQAALAPTLSALLGLPQPPLAQAPPAAALLALPAADVQRALDAHVQARAQVARAVGASGVDPLDSKRAALALAKMGPEGVQALEALGRELDGLARPGAGLLRAALLALALLGLAALLALAPVAWPQAAALRRAGLAVALLALALAPSPQARLLAPGLVAAALGLCALVVLARAPLLRPPAPGGPVRGAAALLAVLLAVPVLLVSFDELRDAAERSVLEASLPPLAAVALLLLGAVALRRRQRARAPRRPAHEALPGGSVPGLCAAALAGALLGGVLSLRPLVDPFVPVAWLVALAALAGMALGLRSPALAGVRPAVRHAAWLLLALALLGPRLLAEGAGSWVQRLPVREAGWALAAGALMLGLRLLLARERRTDVPRLACTLADVALGLAWAGRLLAAVDGLPWALRVLLAFGPQVAAVAALLLALRAPSPAAALLPRLVAALALARRLTASDAECTAFALLAACAWRAGRLPRAAPALALGGLAALVLALRTAGFHALGGTESFSTVDVGAGFLGLETLGSGAQPGVGGVTWPNAVATLQVGLRFALPWLLLFAALAAQGLEAARLRLLLAALAAGFAARAALLLLMLWAFAENAWWVEQAYTVYALGAADVPLLCVAAVAGGAFTVPRLQPGPPAPMMAACSA